MTGSKPEAAIATSLRCWDGILWEELKTRGPAPWLSPVRVVTRRHRHAGLQLCVLCLREDKIPHFKKAWRLLLPFCTTHCIGLLDRCPKCFHAINLHCSDFGRPMRFSDHPWVFCFNCGLDWRTSAPPSKVESVPLTHLISRISGALRGNWGSVGEERIHPIAYFAGLRVLLAGLASNSRSKNLSQQVATSMGRLPFSTSHQFRHLVIERLEIGERIRLFEMLAWILEDWPDRLLRACVSARLKSDAFRRGAFVPWWIEKQLQSAPLNGTFYRPSFLEKQAAIDYLSSQGLSCSRNNLRKWLGLSYVAAHEYFRNQ